MWVLEFCKYLFHFIHMDSQDTSPAIFRGFKKNPLYSDTSANEDNSFRNHIR